MGFSYSGNPASSSKDEVRFLLQDTNDQRPLLSDEDIRYAIARLESTYEDPMMIAAFCADVISTRFALEVSISGDGINVGAQELQQKWSEVAQSLRAQYRRLAGVGALPFAGGVEAFSLPDFSVRALDFGIGMHDNLDAGSQGQIQRSYNGAEFESGPA